MMTLRNRAKSAPQGMAVASLLELRSAVDQRIAERGPSKLARRMQRKRALGMAGAF